MSTPIDKVGLGASPPPPVQGTNLAPVGSVGHVAATAPIDQVHVGPAEETTGPHPLTAAIAANYGPTSHAAGINNVGTFDANGWNMAAGAGFSQAPPTTIISGAAGRTIT